MAATVWRCDAVEQTAAQTALHPIHLPLPLPIHIKNEDGRLYNFPNVLLNKTSTDWLYKAPLDFFLL